MIPKAGVGTGRGAGGRRGEARLKAMLVIAAAAIAALVLQIVANPEHSSEDYVVLAAPPAELVGTWTTEDPGYADRALVIDDDHIELHLGKEGGIQSDPILSIRAIQGPDAWTYEIDYESPQGERTLGVHLHPDGTLRLRNPPNMVWRSKPID